jgi:hypothetical protein
VVGDAHHFAAVNNLMVDFDAHFKINAEHGRFPDHGLLESNTLRNNSIRMTFNPVTPVDLVAASHWVIRRNLISDFIKGDGDRISYGAFAKGAGSDNLMEQNVVLQYAARKPDRVLLGRRHLPERGRAQQGDA